MTRQVSIAIVLFVIVTSTTVIAGFSNPVLLTELNNSVTGRNAYGPSLSSDGMTMYFARKNTSGIGQLVEAYRDDLLGSFTSERILTEFDSGTKTFNPYISADNLRLYYVRWDGTPTGYVTRMAHRDSVNDSWTPGHSLTPGTVFYDIHTNGLHDIGPSLTADELNMFYRRGIGSDYGIYMASRPYIFRSQTQFPV